MAYLSIYIYVRAHPRSNRLCRERGERNSVTLVIDGWPSPARLAVGTPTNELITFSLCTTMTALTGK